jgi:hypothetical protein
MGWDGLACCWFAGVDSRRCWCLAAGCPDRYLSTIDVNGGLYEGPNRTSATGGTGALTDMAVGIYPGTVQRAGDKLTLAVQKQTIPLTGPADCD